VGERFADRVLETMATPATWRAHVVTGTRYVEVKLTDKPGDPSAVCAEPMLGQGSAHGGADHACSVDTLAPNPPETSPPCSTCQAPKAPLLASLQFPLVGPRGFENDLPLAIIRLDDTWITFVPAELTMSAGALVTGAVLRHASVAPDPDGTVRPARAVIAGLANAYIQYVTTRAEYPIQAYEGASNIYGANTAEALALHYGALAESFVDHEVDTRDYGECRASRYDTAPHRNRFPRLSDYSPVSSVHSRGPVSLCAVPGYDPPLICFEWRDAGPSRVSLRNPPWLRLVDHDGQPVCVPHGGVCEYVDDRGIDFQTRVHDEDGDAWTWTTVFMPTVTERDALAGRPLAIRAWDQNGNASVDSSEFTTSPSPSPCSAEETRLCMMPEP
jgi:hypothetical protein